MSERAKSATAWASDTLLNKRAPAHRPRFLRSAWDEPGAQDFGPWRISPRPDPADSQSVPAPHIHPEGGHAEDPGHAAGPSAHGHGSEPAAEALPPSQEPDPDVVKAIEESAYKKGLIAGRQIELDAVQAQRAEERELIRNLSIELRSLQQSPERFFEPLKKLAMHLAETLVRTELQTSDKAIKALIDSCLSQLDPTGEPVSVSLNPADLQRIEALGEAVSTQLRLIEDPTLRPGSVRAQVQDTVVQDLIEHRLEALARKILSDPQAWMQRSTLLHDVVDAMPDDTPERNWKDGAQDIEDVQAEPTKPGAPESP